MKKINYFLVVLFLITNIVMANNVYTDSLRSWSIIGSFGYDWYQASYNGSYSNTYNFQSAVNDGQTAFGRFAIAREIFSYQNLYFGIETGIQSGNTFRLNIQESDLLSIGGMLPQVTIKPAVDFLLTMFYIPRNPLSFANFKLGPAWRIMQINDRVTFNNLSQTGIELQLGGGFVLSSKASLTLNYQLICNGRTTYKIDPTQGIGTIKNIPTQNGLLVGVTYLI